MVRHIVWDWNGTLLGDGSAMVASVISAFRETGLGAVDAEGHRRWFMRPISTFFERLAGRSLTGEELLALGRAFDAAYAGHARRVTLSAGAHDALTAWSAAGRTQSLLSMHPEGDLVHRLAEHGVLDHFTRVDGYKGQGPDTKAQHLKEHLRSLGGIRGEDVVLVGDTVDDALAAQQAGVHCIVYYDEANALQDLGHFRDIRAPIVRDLAGAVRRASVLGRPPRSAAGGAPR